MGPLARHCHQCAPVMGLRCAPVERGLCHTPWVILVPADFSARGFNTYAVSLRAQVGELHHGGVYAACMPIMRSHTAWTP